MTHYILMKTHLRILIIEELSQNNVAHAFELNVNPLYPFMIQDEQNPIFFLLFSVCIQS